MSNADFALKSYSSAIMSFLKAYDGRFWESFGNSYEDVVKCASKAEKAEFLEAVKAMIAFSVFLLKDITLEET